MPEIDVAMTRVAVFIIEGQATVDVLDSFPEPTPDQACRIRRVMCLQQDIGVVEIARDPGQIGRKLFGFLVTTPGEIQHPQIGDG